MFKFLEKLALNYLIKRGYSLNLDNKKEDNIKSKITNRNIKSKIISSKDFEAKRFEKYINKFFSQNDNNFK